MTANPKIFQKGAFRLNAGNTVNLPPSGGGWGSGDDLASLVGDFATPWLTFGNTLDIGTEEDNSITDNAFMSTPVLISKTVDNPLSFYDRMEGINRLQFWMWGFENDVKKVMVFVGTLTPWSTSEPAAGTLFEDQTGTTQKYDFLRTEVFKDSNGNSFFHYVFTNVGDTAAPSGTPSGTLDEIGGTSIVFTYSAHSAAMYEHLFEIEKNDTDLREYTAAEQAMDDFVAGKRNLYATLGKRFKDHDTLYEDALCRSFSWTLSAPGLAQIETNFLAFTENKDEAVTSAGWDFPANLTNNRNVPRHIDLTFRIGATPATLSDICMSELGLSVAKPLQQIQDTCSGENLAVPILEGKYDIAQTGTIARYSLKTFQTIRDAQTTVVTQTVMHQGFLMSEFLVSEANIIEAGPNDDDVSAEPLVLGIGFVPLASDPWAIHLFGNTRLQNSPVVRRQRDFNPVNSMFEE